MVLKMPQEISNTQTGVKSHHSTTTLVDFFFFLMFLQFSSQLFGERGIVMEYGEHVNCNGGHLKGGDVVLGTHIQVQKN